MKLLVDSFDHAITVWSQDDSEYVQDMKKYSDRWISLPVSPSAEQFSRVIFVMIDALLKQTNTINGEKNVSLNSIIVHETATGYAQCFNEDAYSKKMGVIELENIIFSPTIKSEWGDTELFEKLKSGDVFLNPKSV